MLGIVIIRSQYKQKTPAYLQGFFKNMVRPAGVEPATARFVAEYSIQLSHGRNCCFKDTNYCYFLYGIVPDKKCHVFYALKQKIL